MVISIPGSRAVQRYKKKVAPLERHQLRGPIPLPGDRIAQWTAQPIEDRGSKQKISGDLGLPVQHLFQKVVDDIAMIARKRLDETGRILVIPNRERRQLQTGNPAFSSSIQHAHITIGEMQSHDIVEKCARLIRGEPQIGGA